MNGSAAMSAERRADANEGGNDVPVSDPYPAGAKKPLFVDLLRFSPMVQHVKTQLKRVGRSRKTSGFGKILRSLIDSPFYRCYHPLCKRFQIRMMNVHVRSNYAHPSRITEVSILFAF
jgi:hypothetical protein